VSQRPLEFRHHPATGSDPVRPTGHLTKTSYDGAGRVATTTDALGAVTTYVYDAAGRLTGTTDALGRTTTKSYDAQGQLTSITDPAGGVTSYTYDVVGQMTAVTDPDGVTRTTTYDRRGNVAQTSNSTGGWQQTQYDAMGRPVYGYDSDGVNTQSAYDLAGQLIEQAKALATDTNIPNYYQDRTTYAYDVDGHLTSTVDPRGNVPGVDPVGFTTTVTYDADGRPVASTDPLGRTVTTGYDAAGRPVTVTDPAGGVTTTTYNTVGWPTSVTAPNLAKTRYVYDRVGNLTKRVDPLARATTYAYDAAGRLLTQTDALGRVTTMAYDAVGNVTQVVKPSGNVTVDDPTDGAASYAYDAANRLTATTYSDATAGFTDAYSPARRLTTAARVQGGASVVASSAYTYDGAGRTTSTVRTGPGGGTANYAYTSAGRLSGAAWSTGMAAAYSYNSVGELATVTPSGTGNVPAVDYAYDPAGRVATLTRQGAATRTTTAAVYDGAGQLTTLTHAAGGSVLNAYEITRDVRGNPTKLTTATGGATASTLFGYDAVSRLTSECHPTTGDTCASKSPKMSYTYDKVGNRKTQVARTLTGTTASTVSTAYAYDAADELVTQTVAGAATVTNTWTPNGALATSTTPTGTQISTTDLTGELVSLALEDGSTVTYAHDTQGNRTSRTLDGALEATWAWDDVSSLPVRMGEYDAAGSLTTAWLPDPTSTTGASLADVTGGISSWLLSDPFANITATITTTGTTVSGTRALDAFGVALSPATGSLAVAALGFAGQYLDSGTGLYDMRARDYNPTSGRFTATDPVAVPTGMPYVAGYSYAFNNPLMAIDATGAWPSWNDVGNAAAGFGDGLTFGLTRYARQGISNLTGTPDTVDYTSGAYKGGTIAGVVVGVVAAGVLTAPLGGVGAAVAAGAYAGVAGAYAIPAVFQDRQASVGELATGAAFGAAGGAGVGLAGVALSRITWAGGILAAGEGAAPGVAGAVGPGLGATGARTGCSAAETGAASAKNVLITQPRQLQAKFGHAADFGVTGNFNRANAANFNEAVFQHINAPGTTSIRGTYRGDPVTHFLDPATGLNVISRDGVFVSGWRLNPDQLANVLRNGSLGGG
jgi:RHS repeat-associated protein